MGVPKGICANTGRTHFKTGHIPWHKGKTNVYTEEQLQRIGEGSRKAWKQRLAKDPKPWHDKDLMYQEYVDNKKSTVQLAKEWNGEAKHIHKWLQRHKIPIRNQSEAAKNAPRHYGEQSNRWNGGRKVLRGDGYIYVYQGYENGKTHYKFEHVLAAEKALGRYMNQGEVVHHINGNPSDNRNENLLICNRKYHSWLHQRMAKAWMDEHFGEYHG